MGAGLGGLATERIKPSLTTASLGYKIIGHEVVTYKTNIN